MADSPSSSSAAKLLTSNDFLRTQGETEAPSRRGGLDAAAILQHVTEDQFRELQSVWGSRALRAHEFVAMLRGIVIDAGYFHRDGSKNVQAWTAEGWRCNALDVTRPRHAIKGAVAVPTPKRRLGDELFGVLREGDEASSRTQGLDDASSYLYDVFDFIDTRRTKTLTWEGFTMFLVDGISSLNTTNGAGASSVDLTYVFRGELPMLGLEPHETSKEWISTIKYLPSLDSILSASRKRISLLRVDRRSEVIFEHPTTALIAGAEYMASKNLILSSTFQGHLHGWSVSKGKPVEVFKVGVPGAPAGSVATCLMAQGSKLWCGTSTGYIASTIITERGVNKYQFADPKAFRPHTDAVTCMTQLPHNTTVVSASLDHNIYVFDAVGGVGREKEVVGKGHSYGILTMDFNAHSSVLLTGGFEAKICAWAENLWGSPVFALRDTQNPMETVIGIKSIPSTPYVAAADSRGALKIFDLRKRTVVSTMEICDPDNFDAGLLRRDHIRRRDAVANSDMSRTEGEPTVTSMGAAGAAFFSAFEYTGVQHRHLVFGGSRAFYFGMGADTDEHPTQTYNSDRTMRLAHGVDSAFLTVSESEYTLWSSKTGLPDVRRQVTLPEPTSITFAALHPSGDLLVLGHNTGRISTHHLPSGITLRIIKAGHDTAIQNILLHPAGASALITASTDARVCFWNVSIEEADTTSDGGEAQRILPYQIVQICDSGTLVDLHYLGGNTNTLVVLCSNRIAFWSFVAEFRRWVHSYDLPVTISPKPSVASTPVSRRSTTASVAPTPSAAELKRVRARERMLRKQSKAIPTQLDTIVAGSFSPTPRMPTTRQRPGTTEQLLAVVTESGQLMMWGVDTSSGAATPYATTCAPSVARRLLPSATEGVSPKLHCVAFCKTRTHLIATGDDLGRITVWFLGMEALRPRASSSLRQPDGNRIEELSTNPVHGDSILSLHFVSLPLDCIVSMGADRCVCISAWDGTPISRLQQGPLVARLWMVPDGPRHRYTWRRLQALLRWQRLRAHLHGKTLKLAVEDGPPDTMPSLGERPLWSDEEEAAEATVDPRGDTSIPNSRKPSTMPVIAVDATPSTPALTLPSLRGSRATRRSTLFSMEAPRPSDSVMSSPHLRHGSNDVSPRAASIVDGLATPSAASVMFLGESDRVGGGHGSGAAGDDEDDDDLLLFDRSPRKAVRTDHFTALPRTLIAPYVPPKDTLPSVIASRVPHRAPPPPPKLPQVPINRNIIALLHPRSNTGVDLLSPLPQLKLTDPAHDPAHSPTAPVTHIGKIGGTLRRPTRKPQAFETRVVHSVPSMTPAAKRADIHTERPSYRGAATPPPVVPQDVAESHPYGLVVSKKKVQMALRP